MSVRTLLTCQIPLSRCWVGKSFHTYLIHLILRPQILTIFALYPTIFDDDEKNDDANDNDNDDNNDDDDDVDDDNFLFGWKCAPNLAWRLLNTKPLDLYRREIEKLLQLWQTVVVSAREYIKKMLRTYAIIWYNCKGNLNL